MKRAGVPKRIYVLFADWLGDLEGTADGIILQCRYGQLCLEKSVFTTSYEKQSSVG